MTSAAHDPTADASDGLHQLLREWSDPAAHAHADWFAELPAAWRDRVRASAPARRVLGEQLRARVPLRPLVDPGEACAQAGWALAGEAGVMDTVEHVGWSLLQPWVARSVTRAQIACIVECVGPARHDAALRTRPAFLIGDTALPPAMPTATPAELLALIRGLGWVALMRALCGPLEVLRERLRLVASPTLNGLRVGAEPLVDARALLDHLAARPLLQEP
jgi:hypothetical protein